MFVPASCGVGWRVSVFLPRIKACNAMESRRNPSGLLENGKWELDLKVRLVIGNPV